MMVTYIVYNRTWWWYDMIWFSSRSLGKILLYRHSKYKILNCHLTVNFVWPLDRATVPTATIPGREMRWRIVGASGWLSASISAWVPGRDHPSGGNLGVFLVGMARPRSSHDGVFRANGEKHEGCSRTATIAASDSTWGWAESDSYGYASVRVSLLHRYAPHLTRWFFTQWLN